MTNDDLNEFFRTETAPRGRLRSLYSILEAVKGGAGHPFTLALGMVLMALDEDPEKRKQGRHGLIQTMEKCNTIYQTFETMVGQTAVRYGITDHEGTADILTKLPPNVALQLTSSAREQLDALFMQC